MFQLPYHADDSQIYIFSSDLLFELQILIFFKMNIYHFNLDAS